MPIVTRRPAVVASDARTLRAYLREISSLPRLSPEEERELALRIQRDGDEEALRRLIESNLRFVVSYAKRYRGLAMSFLDLIHEGNLGLIEAARRFDPSRNVKFITYAVWWIRQAIVYALSAQTRVFSVPQKVAGAAVRFERDVRALASSLDHVPSVGEIADDLEISEGDVDAMMQLTRSDVSLSEPVGGADNDRRELADTLPQASVPPVDDELIHRTIRDQIRLAVAELNPKEREIMKLRYGLDGDGEPRTLQQIGERLGLSRERVRQIEARATQKLRHSKKVHGLHGCLN